MSEIPSLEEMLINNLKEENRQLKQQLTDKEKELIGRKKLCDLRYEQLKNSHQDKISFAVEQLRQVQKYIITDEKDMFGMPYLMKSSCIYDYIDSQIKAIKEME